MIGATGLQATIDSFNIFVEVGKNKTYVLDQYAPSAYTINTLTAITSGGTGMLGLTREGTGVTGAYGIWVSNSEVTATATGNNVVAAGNTVALVVSNNASALDIAATVKVTRS